MKSAPFFSWTRTCLRPSEGESTRWKYLGPEVDPRIPSVATRIRGPGMSPSLMALRRSTSRVLPLDKSRGGKAGHQVKPRIVGRQDREIRRGERRPGPDFRRHRRLGPGAGILPDLE